MFRLYTIAPDYTLSGWQWKDNNGYWNDFDKTISDEIDNDYGVGVYDSTTQPRFLLFIDKKSLKLKNPINGDEWDIRNNSSGSSHLVSSPSASGGGASKKRSGGSGAGASKRLWQWRWQDEFGQWNDYRAGR